MTKAFDLIDFKTIAAKETNARMRIRLLALAHIKDGTSKNKAAIYLKVSRTSVNQWTSLFLSKGLDGLKEKPRSGRPNALTETQLELLKQHVIIESIRPSGGRLMGIDFVNYIKAEFSVTYSVWNIYKLLHSLNFSWITSRSKHPKQSIEMQDAFKKLSTGNDHSHTWTRKITVC